MPSTQTTNTEGWEKEWNKYCNQFWRGSTLSGIHLEVQEDFGHDFIRSLLLTARREEREMLMHWIEHDSQCIWNQICGGKPFEDGYKYRIGDKWYTTEELPECDCGLDKALSPNTPQE